MRSGVAKMARLLACPTQKASSPISASTLCSIGQMARLGVSEASIWAIAVLSRFFSSIRSPGVSRVTGVVRR